MIQSSEKDSRPTFPQNRYLCGRCKLVLHNKQSQRDGEESPVQISSHLQYQWGFGSHSREWTKRELHVVQPSIYFKS